MSQTQENLSQTKSKTQANLLKAFAGESMARNKYTFYAQKAMKDGYVWIAKIFEETAANEQAHAEREFQLMTEQVDMTNTYNIHSIGTTLENLREAASGEKFEYTTMYPEFEAIAREEGETVIADVFKEIGEVEEKHQERFEKLAEKIDSAKLYEANDPDTEWKCLNCGYIHKGTNAPQVCPACAKPQGWYMKIDLIR